MYIPCELVALVGHLLPATWHSWIGPFLHSVLQVASPTEIRYLIIFCPYLNHTNPINDVGTFLFSRAILVGRTSDIWLICPEVILWQTSRSGTATSISALSLS